MRKLMNVMNVIMITNIIIILVLAYRLIFPHTDHSGAFVEFGYFLNLVFAVFCFYIMAGIHTSILCDKDNYIVSEQADDMKYLGFPFNMMFGLKCVQMLVFIVIVIFAFITADEYDMPFFVNCGKELVFPA